MRIKKLLISFVLIITIMTGMFSAQAVELPGEKDWTGWVTADNQLVDNAVKSADSAIVVDLNSGRIIYQKTAYNNRYPASTTKIMTALLALENTQPTDLVTVSDYMWGYIDDLDPLSTMMHVRRGETLTMKDLLYGLMLESGNDAAIVIGCHVAGSYDGFIQMMNVKAAELGMSKTHYANPHGLTDESHQTCARDMALLAMYVKENYPMFEEIVSTANYYPSDTNLQTHSSNGTLFTNSNKLILEGQQFYYPYATGIKTGFTKAAQGVLVSSAEYQDRSLVAVVMKDSTEGKWINSVTLFNYALDFYDTLKLSELFADNQITATVENANMNTTGNQVTLTLGQGEEVYLTEPTHKAEDILNNIDAHFTETITYTNDTLTAPIAVGDEVGYVTYKYVYSHNSADYLGYKASQDAVQYFEYTAPLYAANAVDAVPIATPVPTATPEPTPEPRSGIFDRLDLDLWQAALIAIGVLFVILVILLIIMASNKGGPNRRYPTNGGRHSYEDRGQSSKNRRRY